MYLLSFVAIGILTGFLMGKMIDGNPFGHGVYITLAIIGALVGGYFFDAFEIGGDAYLVDLVMAATCSSIFIIVCRVFEVSENPDSSLHQT